MYSEQEIIELAPDDSWTHVAIDGSDVSYLILTPSKEPMVFAKEDWVPTAPLIIGKLSSFIRSRQDIETIAKYDNAVEQMESEANYAVQRTDNDKVVTDAFGKIIQLAEGLK